MNTQLIMLPNPIVVSDEQIKKGDFIFYIHFGESIISKAKMDELDNLNNPDKFFKKIIAGIEGLPTVNLSLVAERIGWVDLEKLAEQHLPFNPYLTQDDFAVRRRYFEHGYKAHQSLNEKKYSEEDIVKAIEFGIETTNIFEKGTISTFIDSLSKPKEYLVEVQTERIRYPKGDDGWEDVYTPKITNNTIKILKLL